MVRCKFRCQSKRVYLNGMNSAGAPPEYLYEYVFTAVTDCSAENKNFFKWTPSGKLEVSTVVDGSFEIGHEYYLDLSAVLTAAEGK